MVGVRNVKIRGPAGAEHQGDPSCSTMPGLGRSKTWQRGCRNRSCQSLRTASGRSAAIPEAAAHLSGKQRSEVLTTSSNWTIFSHLSAKQLHQLHWHICARRERHRAKKVTRSFFSSQSLSLLSFSPSCAPRHILGIYQSWRHGLSCLQSRREWCLWHLAKSFPVTYFRSRHSGGSLLRVVIWFMA